LVRWVHSKGIKFYLISLKAPNIVNKGLIFTFLALYLSFQGSICFLYNSTTLRFLF